MQLPKTLKIVNIGIRLFYDSAILQKTQAVHVNWQPAPKLERELEEILRRMGG